MRCVHEYEANLIRFVPIPPGRIEETRHRWLPLVAVQSKKMGEDMFRMIDMIESGDVNIAFAWDEADRRAIAFIGWRVLKLHKQRVGEIIWLAGSDMKLWEPLIPEGERFFREHEKCTSLRIQGRNGWERALSSRGYRKTAVILERSI